MDTAFRWDVAVGFICQYFSVEAGYADAEIIR
jgi:hypothetical protein